jgi:hypothetical protein
MNTSDSCSPYELSFGLRALLGVPSELYFFLRWSFLMLTVSKKSLVTSILIDQQKQERAVLKKAIIFIYGLFGNSYQFHDFKLKIMQKNPQVQCYFYHYKHGQSLKKDNEDLIQYIKEKANYYEDITLVGHSRGGLMAYQVFKVLSVNATIKYTVFTLAAPLHGADLAYHFSAILNKQTLFWKPLQFLIQFLCWCLKTQQIQHDLSIDTVPEHTIDTQVHHLVAHYDIIVGSHKNQQITGNSTKIIYCSHAGMLFSQKVIETVVDQIA